MVLVQCKQCGKDIITTPSRIEHGGGKYCSTICKYKGMSTKVKRTCEICGTSFKVRPSVVKKGGGKYCSKKCMGLSKTGEKNINWNGGEIKRICKNCGKTFNLKPSKLKMGPGIYCSHKCVGEAFKGESNPSWNGGKIKKNCLICDNEFEVIPYVLKKGGGKCCGRECADIHHANVIRGDKNPSWRGGISFEPYCSKFNDEFKERVRNFWDRKCGVCGKVERDNGKRLSVHHVNYNKMSCCDDTPPLFMPLCNHCHLKTNNNRINWEYYLTEFIMIWFDGESYLPK